MSRGRVHLHGWSVSLDVSAQSGKKKLPVANRFPRPDVAAALEGAPGTCFGFYHEQAFTTEPIFLHLAQGSQTYIFQVPSISEKALLWGKRKMALRFVADLLRVTPLLLRWIWFQDRTYRTLARLRLGLDLQAEPGELSPKIMLPASSPSPTRAPVTVVLPVYNAFEMLKECLDRVDRNTDLPFRLIMIEDSSTDARVRPYVQAWAKERQDHVTLLENEQNLGFIGSVNRGLAEARKLERPVILLNCDAFVPENWASRLVRPIIQDQSVATVTPISNNAEIFNVPVICKASDLPKGHVDILDAYARTLPAEIASCEAPTGVGFCMAISPEFLKKIPELDTAFGRGYGEEVDWCQRARAIGGRHLGIANLFVEHRGGESFGSETKLRLVQKHNAVIAGRYPEYNREVQQFIRNDPLATARLAMAVKWASIQSHRPIPIYFAHVLGGGAEQALLRQINRDLDIGRPSLVLRLGGAKRWMLEVHSAHGITSGGTNDWMVIERLLSCIDAREIVYSCAVGDPDPILVPELMTGLVRPEKDSLSMQFHDFFPLSPSYCLIDEDGQYRGLPMPNHPDPAHKIERPDGSSVGLEEWRAAWGKVAQTASKIIVFSQSSRMLVSLAWPSEKDKVLVQPHQDVGEIPPITSRPGGQPVIAVLGAINYAKGITVIAALGRYLQKSPRAKIVVIGDVDPAFPLPDNVTVHGRYRLEDLTALAHKYNITNWLIPSIWPETFSYTTHEVLATGMPVACFNLGAQAEVVKSADYGTIIPLGAAPEDIINLILQPAELEQAIHA
ncbi:MAG: glycosyltransferase [Mangrovicoccus sp.]